MGCENKIEDEFKRATSRFDDLKRGDLTSIGGKDYYSEIQKGRGDLKKGFDDMRGATTRKEQEKAAEEAKASADLAKSYETGTKASTQRRGKDAVAGGSRGTRLTRQPLGTKR